VQVGGGLRIVSALPVGGELRYRDRSQDTDDRDNDK